MRRWINEAQSPGKLSIQARVCIEGQRTRLHAERGLLRCHVHGKVGAVCKEMVGGLGPAQREMARVLRRAQQNSRPEGVRSCFVCRWSRVWSAG